MNTDKTRRCSANAEEGQSQRLNWTRMNADEHGLKTVGDQLALMKTKGGGQGQKLISRRVHRERRENQVLGPAVRDKNLKT
jgi:hypothetical protein